MVRFSGDESLKMDRNMLKADEEYKIRWERSQFGVSAIQENLPFVSDKRWVVDECVRRVSPSIEGMSALISFGLAETDKLKNELHDWFFISRRLRLLQFKDRLDTFLGIHMGRFSPEKYMIFRSTKLDKVARSFAEDGKTGVLELLIKRHSYTLAPSILDILEAIPETLSPHTYVHLLPDLVPPKVTLPRRAQDWCETESVNKSPMDESGVDEVSIQECTEYIVKLLKGLRWPEEDNISAWYLRRARRIDQLSGQLENSLFLLDAGAKKGIKGLEALSKDVADLCRISFANAECREDSVDLSLEAWEKLDGFDKFKLMLRDVTEDTVVDKLLEVAVPYAGEKTQEFLTRYLREISSSNLKLCEVVIDAACKRSLKGQLFQEESDTVNACLACIYGSSQTDQWELMASMLSKLLAEDEKELAEESVNERGIRRGLVNALRYRTSDTKFPRTPMDLPSNAKKKNPAISEELELQVKVAEDYVQAGKILFYYQVPTTIQTLVSASEDVKGTKQMLRILLSKFSRKQPSKTDGDWATLWRDLHFLQEKVFTFLEKDYVLFEFCRGLLKAGKFYLAKSYFKDSMSTLLSSEKVENLVIQTSREYFYSANSLESPDIDMAKECLSIVPSSMAANAELDIIVAVTEKLPYLGVNLLPAQFRQLKDPMEVLKMAIEQHKGSSLPVEDVFEVARLLGFKSASEMAVVEETLAREAAAYGDVLLAQELCLSLAKKGHGKIWDLCVAIGKGSDDEKLDVKSRKELLGFALRHCDDESIGELLSAWKEFDVVDDRTHIPMVDTDELDSAEVSEDETAEPETRHQESLGSTGGSEIFQGEVDARSQTENLWSENDVDVSSTTGNPRTVAERSTEIVLNNFGSGLVTAEDLRDIDTAFSCFRRFAENVTSKQQATALKCLLEVWEPAFESGNGSAEATDARDVDEEGWNDGWQDFDVAEVSTVCQLHTFWKIVCDKLIDNHALQVLLEALDRRSSGTSVLLTEEEAKEVIGHIASKEVFSALKLSLLLPYETVRSPCLRAVELEFQRYATVPDSSTFVLVVSSGLVPSLAGSSGLFSGVYKAATEHSRKSRSGLLLPEDSLGAASLNVILPYYISELTKGRHYRAAASLVLQEMRVPSALATWNVSHFALKRYLEGQQSQLRQRKLSFDLNRVRQSSLSYLSEIIGRMVTSFDTVATEALNTLAKDMK